MHTQHPYLNLDSPFQLWTYWKKKKFKATWKVKAGATGKKEKDVLQEHYVPFYAGKGPITS